MVIKIKDFCDEIILDFPSGPSVLWHISLLVKGNERFDANGRRGGNVTPEIEISGAGPSQRMLTATKSWKRKEPILPKSL